MKKTAILIISLLVLTNARSQTWVDTSYTYQQTNDISYGNAVDFAGNIRSLTMDICVPTNDVAPTCGRPLLIMVHGGAFISGTKNDILPQHIIKDFAKRGYVAVSPNYRLGMFETSSNIHCNIGNGWDCLNMADTAEWLRANYRAMQDVKGAIRYMIAHASTYNIDPRNVFVVGESAGAITVMSVVYLDDNNEKYPAAYGMPDAAAPNANYEGQCIQTYGFDTSIASMQLQRPDLGSINGDLNPGNSYNIKGAGSFYGGMFANLFSSGSNTKVPLYLFHQPNDLLVPYTKDRVLAGYAYCSVTLGGCQYLINRPYISGGRGMVDYIQALPQVAQPQYVFDSTNNSADCLQQINDPNSIGHAVDNYWLRSTHMAQLFAAHVDVSQPCGVTSLPMINNKNEQLSIYPIPAHDKITINVKDENITQVTLIDMNSKKTPLPAADNVYSIPPVSPGVYFIQVKTGKHIYTQKIIKQ